MGLCSSYESLEASGLGEGHLFHCIYLEQFFKNIFSEANELVEIGWLKMAHLAPILCDV